MKLRMLFGLLLLGESAHALEFDAQEMLAAHNRWRATVNAAPLSYSPDLAASAQRWADSLKQHNRCRMQHSKPDVDFGENLYWASAVEWSDGRREVQQVKPAAIVDDWGSESADYDYAGNRCAKGKMCGHYTQVIWKSTTRVGCAVAVCEDSSEQIWVCQYQPPGNWVGQKPY